jgi:branched-chain amino acid transport system ATP-binding protein
MGELIEKIKKMDITVLLVEHDMELVMEISDRVAVINFGRLIAEGPPAEIQANEDVIAAYLGE